MIKQVTMTIEVPDGTNLQDIRSTISNLLLQSDGEQHLELMNFEPVPVKVVQPTTMEFANKIDVEKAKKQMTVADGEVAVMVYEKRSKVFMFNVPGDKDPDDAYWDCAHRIEAAYSAGILPMDDALTESIEYYDADAGNGVDEYNPIWLDGMDSPEENADWLFNVDEIKPIIDAIPNDVGGIRKNVQP